MMTTIKNQGNALLDRLNTFIDNRVKWIEPHIVGRIGLFRIIYAVFYLWVIARYNYPELATIPAGQWKPLITYSWMPTPPIAPFLIVAQIGLILGLMLVLVGYRTRFSTLLVLLTGIFLTGVRYSFNKMDHYDHLMVSYIPAIMFLYDWGRTYSIDAILRARRGISVPDPNTSNWQDAWPLLLVLAIVVVLFTMAGVLKLYPDRGSWIWNEDVIRKVTHKYNKGFEPNPLAFLIVNNAIVYGPLRFLAVGFETSFILAIFSRRFRAFFIGSAVLFHLYNLVFNGIDFVEMMIVYAFFIDWQALYTRFWPQMLKLRLANVPTMALTMGSAVLAVGLCAWWVSDFDSLPRQIFRLVPTTAIWAVTIPVALYAVMSSGRLIALDALAYARRLRTRILPGRTLQPVRVPISNR